jgi:hypothetical protein
VLNAGMVGHIFDLFAELMALCGEPALAKQAREKAEAQRLAVREQFTGQWFKRAWLKDDLWIGNDEICLEPQPWALISGSATPEQAQALVNNIDTLLRRPSQFGAMLNRGLPHYAAKPGIAHNGGIVPAINGPLVWGLSLIDPVMAWDEWKRNSLSWHAETFPDLWYGIWSGSDFYNSDLSPYPGSTVFPHHIIGHPEEIADRTNAHRNKGVSWSDFPVMNMHAHAWPLYSLTKFLGLIYTCDGIEITPRFPMKEFRFASPLVGLERTEESLKGWYNPKQNGEWKITILLSADDVNSFHLADGFENSIHFEREDRSIILKGIKTSVAPIRWHLEN